MATTPDDLLNDPHVRTAVQTALIERFKTLLNASQTLEREEAAHLERAREVRARIAALDKEVNALKAVLATYDVQISSVTDNGDGDTTVNTNVGVARFMTTKPVFAGGGPAVAGLGSIGGGIRNSLFAVPGDYLRQQLLDQSGKARRSREEARRFRETVLSAVKTILEVTGPTPTKELFDMLVNQKVDIESPERLSQILSAADQFVADRSKGWSLKGEEPGGGTPSSSESTATPSGDGP